MAEPTEPHEQSALRPLMVIPRIALGQAVLFALLFGSAGRLDLPFFWAVIGLMIAVGVIALFTMDRGLLRERIKPAPGGKDRHIRLMVMPFAMSHLVLAGLDARFGWSYVPAWVQSAGLIGMALSFSLSIWAIRVNRFFSPVVRIQSERGHHLVTGGPYAHIRHPGYCAGIQLMAFSGLALGSWWSLLPNVVNIAIMLRRLIIEDRFLHENLEGYPDYARRVRWRLAPKLW